MKIVCLLLIVFTAVSARAQDYDSLKQKILKMDVAINAIHHNMLKSHNQFRVGTFMMLTGTAMTIAGALIIQDKDGDLVNQNKNPALMYIGAGVTIVGGIIQIDAHKWIGRGGRMRQRER